MKKEAKNVTSITGDKKSPFKKGDVVVLRSGSNTMVVNAVKEEAGRNVQCAFMDHMNQLQTQDFSEHLLETHEDHIKRNVRIHDITCPHNPKNNEPSDNNRRMIAIGPNGQQIDLPPEIMKMFEDFIKPS